MFAEKCELCGCEKDLTRHHLIPVSRLKNKYAKVKTTDEGNWIWICRQCHDHIHAVKGESDLRDNFNTKEKLLADPEIAKFVAWRTKHPDFDGHSKMSNGRRARR